MRIPELPEPYKSLAIRRREEHRESRKVYRGQSYDEDCVNEAISWAETPEDKKHPSYWVNVYNAKIKETLPPFPYDLFPEYIQPKEINHFKFC